MMILELSGKSRIDASMALQVGHYILLVVNNTNDNNNNISRDNTFIEKLNILKRALRDL